MEGYINILVIVVPILLTSIFLQYIYYWLSGMRRYRILLRICVYN